jgi:hypothetical protein
MANKECMLMMIVRGVGGHLNRLDHGTLLSFFGINVYVRGVLILVLLPAVCLCIFTVL